MRAVTKFPPPLASDDIDWERLLDGRIWELTADKDFACQPHSFRVRVYAQANKHGLKVKIAVRDDKVYVQRLE